MVTVGTRWYLLGLAAAPLYQRVPTSPNSHKHNQDSNSLGGTIKPQVKGLKFPVACLKSGTKSRPSEGQTQGKTAAQRPCRSISLHLGAQESLLLRVGLRRRLSSDLLPDLLPDCTVSPSMSGATPRFQSTASANCNHIAAMSDRTSNVSRRPPGCALLTRTTTRMGAHVSHWSQAFHPRLSLTDQHEARP